MTLIFSTTSGTITLAGDLLISAQGAPYVEPSLRLPSYPEGIAVPSSGDRHHVPMMMRRKLFIVNDRMAVGVAGAVTSIQSFLETLMDRFSLDSNFTFGDVKGFMDEYDSSLHGYDTLEEIGSLLLVEAADWRGILPTGRYAANAARDERSRNFGHVVSIGTGRDALIKNVQRLDGGMIGMSETPQPDTFPEFRPLAAILVLVATMYRMETFTPQNLWEGWGAGYEVVYQDTNKRFRYLDDYTLFFTMLDLSSSKREIDMNSIFKYQRRPNYSLMSTFADKLTIHGARDITCTDSNPLSITLSQDDLSLNSKIHVCIVAVVRDNRLLNFYHWIDGYDGQERSTRSIWTKVRDDGRLAIFMNSAIKDWMEKLIRSDFPETSR